ncbi:hypothetical protein [Salinicola rhizosphaerae]|uniref:Uncharacterized protein n=1 Tax=Salinicola rhizosphaerae TaxID=1443141 RepID=A0ABQ3DR80_9GAMM|nr:hypothetical protein [Salinicola rhizosphaerae]GHB12933.1 hypothetical protein GCM10009038_08720 [Salinicola rhizosphaerae]
MEKELIDGVVKQVSALFRCSNEVVVEPGFVAKRYITFYTRGFWISMKLDFDIYDLCFADESFDCEDELLELVYQCIENRLTLQMKDLGIEIQDIVYPLFKDLVVRDAYLMRVRQRILKEQMQWL